MNKHNLSLQTIRISLSRLLPLYLLVALNTSAQSATEWSANSTAPNKVLIASLFDNEKYPYENTRSSQNTDMQDNSWAFYLDNDLFASTGKDRDYTGGLSITYSGHLATEHPFSMDAVLSGVNDTLGVHQNSHIKLQHSMEFGMTAFTPDNILSKEVLRDDRPYASLLYISNTRQYLNSTNKSSILTTLTIGILGMDIAGEFQNSVHKAFGSKPAEGWDNQISDGGEPSFRYNIAAQRVRWSNYRDKQSNYEIKTAHSLSVGYLTEANWSLSARIGHLRSPWSSFNPHNVSYSEKNSPLDSLSSKPKNEFYIWGGFSLHARLYNVFLQGQFRDSAITYDYDEIKHFIVESWLGVTRETRNGIRFSYFIRGQTSEIKHGPGSRNPVWGGIMVTRFL